MKQLAYALVLFSLASAAMAQSAPPATAEALNQQKQELLKQQGALWARFDQIRQALAKEADLADLRAVIERGRKVEDFKPPTRQQMDQIRQDLEAARRAYRQLADAAVAGSPEIAAAQKDVAVAAEPIAELELDIRIAKYALGELRGRLDRSPEVRKLYSEAQAAEKACQDHPAVAAARKAMDDARKDYDARRRAPAIAAAPTPVPTPTPTPAPTPTPVDRSALAAAEKALDELPRSAALAEARKAVELANKACDDALSAAAAANPRWAPQAQKIAQAEAQIKAAEARLKEKREKLYSLKKDVEAKDPRIAAARKAADDAQKEIRKIADAAVAANPEFAALNKEIAAAQESIEDHNAEVRIAKFILDEVRKKTERREDIVKIRRAAEAADKAMGDHPAVVAAANARDAARKEWESKGRPANARDALNKAEKAYDTVQKSDELAALRKAKEQAWKLYDETLTAQVAASERGAEQTKKVAQAEAEIARLQAAMKTQQEKCWPLRNEIEAKDPKVAQARKAADDAQKARTATIDAVVAADPGVMALTKEIVAGDDVIEDLNLEIRVAKFVQGEVRAKVERAPELQKLRAEAQVAQKALDEHPAMAAARKAVDDARKDYEARKKAAAPPATPAPAPTPAPPPTPKPTPTDRSALAAAEKAYDEVQKSDALAGARKAKEQAWKAYEDGLTAKTAADPRGQEEAKKIEQAQAAIRDIQAAIKEKRDKLPTLAAELEARDPNVAEARKAADSLQKTMDEAAKLIAKPPAPPTAEEKAALAKAQQQFDKRLEAKLAADMKAVDLRKQIDELDRKIRAIDQNLAKLKKPGH